MRCLKYSILTLSLILASGFVWSVQAQKKSRPRPTLIVANPYTFDGRQVSTGLVPGSSDVYFVTFAGQADNLNNHSARTDLTLTLFYTASGGTGQIVGGQWTLVQEVGEGQPFTTGGMVSSSALINLKTDNTIGQGTFSLSFDAADLAWPISADFTGTTDDSRPPKIEGNFLLVHPHVL